MSKKIVVSVCGSSWIKRNGSRQVRQPGIKGDRGVRIQRYRCKTCLGIFTNRDQARGGYTKTFKIEVTRSRVKAKKRFNELRHRCMLSSVSVQ